MLGGPDLPELSERMNALRGLPSMGPDSAFHDMFFDYDIDSRISICARGDWEEDSVRALEIFLQERKHIDAIRDDNPSQSHSTAIEHLTRPEFESEMEIVFKYKHNDGEEYLSRAWSFTGQSVQSFGMETESISKGIMQKRQAVRNRTNSTFIPAAHRENLQTTAASFSATQLQGDMDRILAITRLVESRLKALTLVTINNVPVIHARLKGMKRLIPVQLLGEGLNRMLGFALSMGQASGGMMLIDEIENGMHYRVQEEMFSLLLKLAKAFDVQIIATTHSRECINAAHHALNRDGQEEVAYYRLDNRAGEGVKAYRYDSEMLETSIDFGMEPR